MANIINLMKELGYIIPYEGACFGLSREAENKRACNRYAEFHDIMTYLNVLPDELPEGQRLTDRIAQAEKHDEALKNETPTPLTKDEKILLTIKDFFFRVSVYQNPKIIQEFCGIINTPKLNQHDISKVDALMNAYYSNNNQANNTETLTPITKSTNYLLNSMEKNNYHQSLKYFLEEAIKGSEIRSGLLISSSTHTIHLFYDKKWYLTNHSKLESYNNFNSLLLALWKIFNNNTCHLNIRVFLPKDNPETKRLEDYLAAISKFSIEELSMVNINATDHNGATLLHVAADHGHIKETATLLENRANVNVSLSKDITPLYIAAQNGHADIVALLLKNGARVDTTSSVGSATPLHIAATNGHTNVIALLLETNPFVDVLSPICGTPLYIAAQNGHADIVELLLKKKANPNVLSLGMTPLQTAAYYGYTDVVNLLLENGASVNIAFTTGQTALDIARMRGHGEIVKLIETKINEDKQQATMTTTAPTLFSSTNNKRKREETTEKPSRPSPRRAGGAVFNYHT